MQSSRTLPTGTPVPTDKRKQSLYFPEDMLQEMGDEAKRQDRSLSWLVQQAWRIAREKLSRTPGINDPPSAPSPAATDGSQGTPST